MSHPSKLLEHTEAIVSEYNAGIHGTVLARKYNVKDNTIYQFLRSQGVEIRARGGSTAKYESFNDKFVSLYREGNTIDQIADQLKVGTGTVQRAIAKYGKPRPNGTRKQSIIVPVDPAVIGYIAGLLDGEGNLQLKNDHDSISCRLSIYNTCYEVIEWLQKTVGGKVLERDREGWQICYVWTLYRVQDVYALLKTVQPYLIIKREKCGLMIEILKAKLD